MITYEYPLIERIRTLLRLEDLFDRTGYFLNRPSVMNASNSADQHDHHVVLLTLFEILEVVSRAELKSELLQELERQRQVVASFRSNPDIDQGVLAKVLEQLDQASAGLFNMSGKVGQYLRENDWLMGIKQRTTIPGGACEFDLPSYHHWLHRGSAERLNDIESWITPLYPIRDGAAIVLKLLRESGKPVRVLAPQGMFQQMLGGRMAQMVRIRLPQNAQEVPEISANRYALNIRFTVIGRELRPRTAETDVGFELTFCSM